MKTGDSIDPKTLMRIRSLALRARAVVEGFQSGLNRSPFHGFSVEFSEYRQYTPGDDPRYLDWRLFARSDRYYVKKFEDETNLRCHLLLDLSKSMSYGSQGYSKIEYARTLAATLAYFLSSQRDAVGLMTFDEHVQDYIPAGFRSGHLRRLMRALARQVGGRSTSLNLPLEQAADQLNKRGMIILLSDLLAPLEGLHRNLGLLRARGHEVLVFHVLDPAEVSFDFEQPALFQDLETGQKIYVDPRTARETWLARFGKHLDTIRGVCEQKGITYRRFTTDTPLELALAEFLRSRMQGIASPARSVRHMVRRPP